MGLEDWGMTGERGERREEPAGRLKGSTSTTEFTLQTCKETLATIATAHSMLAADFFNQQACFMVPCVERSLTGTLTEVPRSSRRPLAHSVPFSSAHLNPASHRPEAALRLCLPLQFRTHSGAADSSSTSIALSSIIRPRVAAARRDWLLDALYRRMWDAVREARMRTRTCDRRH